MRGEENMFLPETLQECPSLRTWAACPLVHKRWMMGRAGVGCEGEGRRYSYRRHLRNISLKNLGCASSSTSGGRGGSDVMGEGGGVRCEGEERKYSYVRYLKKCLS